MFINLVFSWFKAVVSLESFCAWPYVYLCTLIIRTGNNN